MTKPHLQFTRIVFVALAMSLGLAMLPSQAAPVISKGYYEEYKTKSCTGSSSSCTLPFTAVSATKTLILSNVSCEIKANSTSVNLLEVAVFGNGLNSYLNIVASPWTGARRYPFSQQLTKVYIAGQSPFISVTFSFPVPIVMFCTIAGQLL